MQKLTFLALVGGLFASGPAQELSVSASAKTYASGEQIWANVSVLGASTLPGAYAIKINYDAQKLKFLNILPAQQGPFSVTPAASNSGGVLTIAGFQGIVDTGRGNTSLATLVFTPLSGSTAIDSASFSVSGKEVYNTQAQIMDLKVTKQTASVLLASPGFSRYERIILTKNYLRFSVIRDGIASVRIFDLAGRTCAVPLAPAPCKAGYHAVPLGRRLRSGIYVVTVRSPGLCATEKVEVVR
jgi:hypothetical protein